MNTPTRTAAAAFALMALAACQDRQVGRADANICQPFPAATGTGAPGSEAATLDDCLHRAAYRLARAGDGADIVAQATVAACGESLSRWNTTAVNTPATANGNGADSDTAVDLVTGQPTSQLAQRYQFAQGRALYYVVQARAGRCEVPAAAPAAPR